MHEEPQSIWQGSFKVFGVEVKCHTLDNGERVIELESVKELFTAMGEASPDTTNSPDADAFVRWQRKEES